MFVVLGGGVGAARFLTGLLRVVPPSNVAVVGNTGDDDTFYGLHVSPDLDTVTYTLAGVVSPTGWGIAGDTFGCLDQLGGYGAPTWFRLGDTDLATHLYRSSRLAEGATLSEVTAEIAARFGLACRILPMSDERVATRIDVAGGGSLAMQEWFVRDRCEPPVLGVRFEGAETARPAPGVLELIAAAEGILVCPSNPVISIGPILALPGVTEALRARRDRVVAVSPIIRGAPVKGPADTLMRAVGLDVSCAGVAAVYAEFCAALLIDTADAALSDAVEAHGVRAVATPILMVGPDGAERLAKAALIALGRG